MTGTQTAKCIAWDASNLKVWYELPVGSWPSDSHIDNKEAGGGSGTITDSYVGTSGRVVFYDRLTGTLLFQNDSLFNNVKSQYYTGQHYKGCLVSVEQDNYQSHQEVMSGYPHYQL